MNTELLLRLRPIFEQHLGSGGFVLVDMRFFRDQSRRSILEVLADRPLGGISLDECSMLNKELGELIENSGLVQEPYVLEVSSPGIDRPLATEEDFRRVIGRQVRFFLGEPLEGRIEYTGKVEEVSQEKVKVLIENRDPKKEVQIPLGNINKAKQVIV